MTLDIVTTNGAAIAPAGDQFTPIIDLVTVGLTSAHSKRAYKRILDGFLSWYDDQGRPGFTKATVNRYREHLLEAGLGAAAVNQSLSAIRRLAVEAADNGLIDPQAAAGVGRVKGVKQQGRRAGNWLEEEEAQRLLYAPDTSTLKGLRDRALLAVLLGGALRRFEAAALTFEHIQQRDGRWAIVDLVGKGRRIRLVPIPPWTKVAIDAWAAAAGLDQGLIFRPVDKGGRLERGRGITPQAIYNVVAEYAAAAGLDAAAHDLRRTFAKLAYKKGAGIDQIQKTLGHATILTTERYLGVDQDMTNAPCDVLGLHL